MSEFARLMRILFVTLLPAGAAVASWVWMFSVPALAAPGVDAVLEFELAAFEPGASRPSEVLGLRVDRRKSADSACQSGKKAVPAVLCGRVLRVLNQSTQGKSLSSVLKKELASAKPVFAVDAPRYELRFQEAKGPVFPQSRDDRDVLPNGTALRITTPLSRIDQLAFVLRELKPR